MECGWNARDLSHSDCHTQNLHPQHLLRGLERRVGGRALLESSQGGEFDGSLQLTNPTAPGSHEREEETSCCEPAAGLGSLSLDELGSLQPHCDINTPLTGHLLWGSLAVSESQGREIYTISKVCLTSVIQTPLKCDYIV